MDTLELDGGDCLGGGVEEDLEGEEEFYRTKRKWLPNIKSQREAPSVVGKGRGKKENADDAQDGASLGEDIEGKRVILARLARRRKILFLSFPIFTCGIIPELLRRSVELNLRGKKTKCCTSVSAMDSMTEIRLIRIFSQLPDGKNIGLFRLVMSLK